MKTPNSLTVIKGPKLQTFYTCRDGVNKCEHVEVVWLNLSEEVVGRCSLTHEELEVHGEPHIITPIDCPLLGKTQEEDMNFDKDVLMRNL